MGISDRGTLTQRANVWLPLIVGISFSASSLFLWQAQIQLTAGWGPAEMLLAGAVAGLVGVWLLVIWAIFWTQQPVQLGVIPTVQGQSNPPPDITLPTQLSRLLAANPAVIYSAKPTSDYGTTFISENVVALFGYSAQEFLAEPNFWLKHVHPADVDRIVMDLSQITEREQLVYEYRFLYKNGDYRWTADTVRLVRDATGQPVELVGSWQDVHNRKLTEAALQESLHHLAEIKLALDQSSIVAITDERGVIQSVNQKFCEISGYDQEELIGCTHQLINSGYHPKSFFTHLWQTIANGQIWKGEIKNRAKNGSCYWVDTTIVPLLNAEGKPYQYVSIRNDITARKQAEMALYQQAQREHLVVEITQRIRQSLDLNAILTTTVTEVRQFLECDRTLIYRFTPDWSGIVVVESVGAGWLPILGAVVNDSFFQDSDRRQTYTSGQIQVVADVNRSQLAHCHIALLQQFQIRANLVVPILQDDTLWGLLVANQCAAPREWQPEDVALLQNLATQVAIAIQQAQLYEQVQRELHERQRAETTIREQAELLDVATDAILVSDLNHKICYWNKGAERIYGWSASEVMGQRTAALLYPKTSTIALDIYHTVLGQGTWQGELQQLDRTNQEITVASRWTLVRNSQGQAKAILMVNTDITQKKHLERQFLRSQRLESIGTLAGGIAHDLNNILSPILLSVQLLQMQLTDDRSQQWLDIVESSTRRGTDLIRQVLSFARGIEGQQGALQVRHLIAEVQQIVEETFPRSIQVRTHVAHDLWTVCGDATHLHQVLMNLCVNARDAMPEGGTLQINAKNLVLHPTDSQFHIDALPGNYILITVKDSGSGISADLLDRIFEPFFTTKPLGKGTGLGLSTVIGIVQSHHGFITVSSQLHYGTEFKIFLPALTESNDLPLMPAKLCQGQGEWILVIDDEAPIREMAVATLTAYNYQVMTAADGIEAISLYTQHQDKIALVLVDMMMPVMNGAVTICALRKLNPLIKILASSGVVLDLHLPESNNAVLELFLPKPYTTEQLLGSIQTMLGTAP